MKQFAIGLLLVAIGSITWLAMTTPRVDGLSLREHMAYVVSGLRGANDRYCMMRLNKVEAAYEPASLVTDAGCGSTFAVRASKIGQAKLKSAPFMSCRLAETLAEWENEVLQPAARAHFGKPIQRIQHIGTYNCRRIRGSSRMSQHAYANAIDVSGFVLEGGGTISLKRDWFADNAKAKFLQALKQPTCDAFNVTLTPDKDAAHADHFHLDMGLWRACR